MKQLIFTVLLSFMLVGMLVAQPHKITYTFSIEKCSDFTEMDLFGGVMNEGDSFILESATIPSEESQMQFFYNLLVGSECGLPLASLKEDINLHIILKGVCDLDINNLPKDKNLIDLLSFDFEITGANSGMHTKDDVYNFENGKEFYIKVLMTKIAPFLAFLSYSVDDFTPYFIKPNKDVDFAGIRKENDAQHFSIFASHFSTIGVGIQKDVTGVEEESLVSSEFSLAQNYPNPFNPSTKISYNLPSKGFTKLAIYNAIGKEVQIIFNETQKAGLHSVDFNASNLPSGMYFYTLTSGSFTQTNKMILMK